MNLGAVILFTESYLCTVAVCTTVASMLLLRKKNNKNLALLFRYC